MATTQERETMVRLPTNPYAALFLGLALGGGGGTTLNSLVNTGLSDSDLAKIEVIVAKAVEQSEGTLRLETKIDIKTAIDDHSRLQADAIKEALEAHVRQYHRE
jgi:hypothetical protein